MISRNNGLAVREQFNHYPIAFIEVDILVLSICDLLHNCLGLQELLFEFSENRLPISQEVIHSIQVSGASKVLGKIERLFAESDLIWRSPSTRMPRGII